MKAWESIQNSLEWIEQNLSEKIEIETWQTLLTCLHSIIRGYLTVWSAIPSWNI